VAIIVSDMRKSFHGVTAIDKTSFTVEDSEFFAVLGPQGSGKSTLIACLSTLVEPDSGLVEINGHTRGDSEAIAADIGVLFESIYLDLNLTVRQNISFHAALRGIEDEDSRLDRLAARLDITQILNRRLGRVSPGEQRRVDLARALIHSPTVLLVDEPTLGLDPHSTAVIWRVIQEQHDRGTTILLATEDASAAERAERVGILVDGRMMATGSPASLVADYCPSVLTMDLADPKSCRRELASLDIDMPDPDPDGRVTWRLDSMIARDVLSLLSTRVRQFEFRNGTLEEVVRVFAEEYAEFDEEPYPESAEEDVIAQDETEWYEQADFDGVIAPVWSEEDTEEETEQFGPEVVEYEEEPLELEDPFEEDSDQVEEEVEPFGEDYEPFDEDYEPFDEVDEVDEVEPFAEETATPEEAEYLHDIEAQDAEDYSQWTEWAKAEATPLPPQQHWSRARRFSDAGRGVEIRGPYIEPHPQGSTPPEEPVLEEEFFAATPVDDDTEEDAYQPDDVSVGELPYEDEEFAYEDEDGFFDDEYYETFTPEDEISVIEREIAQAEDEIGQIEERAREAEHLDRLAIVSRLLEDAVLEDPLPPFDEKFPIDRLPFVTQELTAPPPPRRTTWYEEMRRPINEEMAKQARIKLAVEKRLEEARRRRTDEHKED